MQLLESDLRGIVELNADLLSVCAELYLDTMQLLNAERLQI